MSGNTEISRGTSLLLGTASTVVLIGAMQAAQAIVVPTLLAIFLALLGTPALFWLRRKGVPNGISVLLVVTAMLLMISMALALLGGSAAEFTNRVPYYEHRLQELTNSMLARIGANEDLLSVRELLRGVDPGAAWGFATTLLNGLSGVLGNALLIVFTIIFLLLEASILPDKIAAIARGSWQSREYLESFVKNLNRYVWIKTTTSFATGLTVWIWLTILEVDFPVLWGLLAFVLNFVPTIGSIIAAIPAVLLALVQHGPGVALFAAAGYLAVNILIGNLIEPRVMGRGLGLSTLVVFLSLIFWGWILGPVGMLLSVPLTMTVKIALESSSKTRPFAILLSSGVPKRPLPEPESEPAPEPRTEPEPEPRPGEQILRG